MASAGIFSVIIHKLIYQQKFNLIVLLKIDKNLKINLYNTLLLFDLAISLKIKSNKKLPLDLEKIIKQQLKLGNKK